MSRFDVIMVALAVSSGCSTSAGAPKSDANGDGMDHDEIGSTDRPSTDGAAPGTPYPCVGGFVLTADGGEVRVPLDAGAPVTCVVGQSYCSVESLDKVVGALPSYQCMPLTAADGGPGVCAETPTCACICAHGATCVTECSCDDTGGFATISCHQV